MFDGTTKMFEGYKSRVVIKRKKEYENKFNAFMEDNKDCFDEMFRYLKGREDKEVAAKEVANIIAENVISDYGKKGKIPRLSVPEITLFFIYFVFPTIIKYNDESSTLLADAIRDEWRVRTNNPALNYTTYEELVPGFREKIFGIF